MKTLWDLIQEWRSVQADAERIEVQARKTRLRARELDAEVTSQLLQHGPVVILSELFLPPEGPNESIRVVRVKNGIEIVLPQPEEPESQGGVA